MGDVRTPDGLCCGTCELAELTAQGKVSFQQSPHLFVGDDVDDVIVVVHEMLGDGLVVRRLSLRRGQRLVVGRSADVDIVIRSKFADRRIFALEVTAAGAVFAEDVGSSCGTLVKGRRIARQRLDQCDVINVASNTFLTFQHGDEIGGPTAIELAYAARKNATEATGSAVASAPARGAVAVARPGLRAAEPVESEVIAAAMVASEHVTGAAELPTQVARGRSVWQWLRARLM
jgi:FHA domain